MGWQTITDMPIWPCLCHVCGGGSAAGLANVDTARESQWHDGRIYLCGVCVQNVMAVVDHVPRSVFASTLEQLQASQAEAATLTEQLGDAAERNVTLSAQLGKAVQDTETAEAQVLNLEQRLEELKRKPVTDPRQALIASVTQPTEKPKPATRGKDARSSAPTPAP